MMLQGKIALIKHKSHTPRPFCYSHSLTRISFAMSFLLSSSTGYNSRCMSSRLATSAPSLPFSSCCMAWGLLCFSFFASYVLQWYLNRTSLNVSSLSYLRSSFGDPDVLNSHLFHLLQLRASSQFRVNLAPLPKSLFVHTTRQSYTQRHTLRHPSSSQESANKIIFESTFSFSIPTHYTLHTNKPKARQINNRSRSHSKLSLGFLSHFSCRFTIKEETSLVWRC